MYLVCKLLSESLGKEKITDNLKKKKIVQHIVSIGIFELVVVLNVLFVIDSPIDANPFDELECC